MAKAEQVQPPTMSRIVEALVEQGLARREVNKTDRRLLTISATEKGTKIMQEGRRRRIKHFHNLLSPLPRRDLETLKRAADILSEVLQTH